VLHAYVYVVSPRVCVLEALFVSEDVAGVTTVVIDGLILLK